METNQRITTAPHRSFFRNMRDIFNGYFILAVSISDIVSLHSFEYYLIHLIYLFAIASHFVRLGLLRNIDPCKIHFPDSSLL